MIKLVYTVPVADKDSEISWLAEQKVYPGVAQYWDWSTNTPHIKIGAIVSPEAAMAIKLRHNLDIQITYKQRQHG